MYSSQTHNFQSHNNLKNLQTSQTIADDKNFVPTSSNQNKNNDSCNSFCQVKTKDENMHEILKQILIKLLSARVVLERLPSDVTRTVTQATSHNQNEIHQKNSQNLIRRVCPECDNGVQGNSVCCKKCRTRLIYVCKKCDKSYRHIYGAFRHLKSSCNFQGYDNSCSLCDYKTTCNYEFRKHMKGKHSIVAKLNELVSYKCLECHKQFKNQRSLNIHTRYCDTSKEVIDEKNVEIAYCATCNQYTSMDKGLASDRRPIYCDDCRSTLQFQCWKCKQMFANHRVLTYHSASCIHQKLFKCSKCNYQSSHRASLYKHCRRRHDFINVECPDCGKTLKNREYMKDHLRFVCRKNKAVDANLKSE